MLKGDALIADAQARSGLSDFGDDGWRKGFDRLVRSFNEDAALNELGEQVIGDALTTKLANRLRIEDWWRRHPEIADQQIVPPLFGLGLPRTGSTALGVMLSLDPARRSVRTWEADNPCPPPTRATQDTDPRIAISEAILQNTYAMFPDYRGMLPTSAQAPTECLLLLAFDFHSQDFDSLGYIAGYDNWLLDCDMEPSYRYHRRVLQLLQWRCPPNRWCLRTPAHSQAIFALDKVYPDARFVMTHRHISQVIPSLVALLSALSATLSRDHDPARLARHVMDIWSISLQRLLAFRDAGNEHRFFDIDFARFQTAPLERIRHLYDWLDEPLSEEAATRMADWWRKHAADRRPSKRHDPEEFGISAGDLAERFAFYNDRFAGAAISLS